MLFKKTKQLTKALNEVIMLINNSEAHVKKLLASCTTLEQVESLRQYTDQLFSNIECISTHYKPSFWWRKMYQKEIQFRLFMSAGNMYFKINEKVRELQNN